MVIRYKENLLSLREKRKGNETLPFVQGIVGSGQLDSVIPRSGDTLAVTGSGSPVCRKTPSNKKSRLPVLTRSAGAHVSKQKTSTSWFRKHWFSNQPDTEVDDFERALKTRNAGL